MNHEGIKHVRPREFAKQHGLSVSGVTAALRSGQLPGVRLGRRWLVPVNALDMLQVPHHCTLSAEVTGGTGDFGGEKQGSVRW